MSNLATQSTENQGLSFNVLAAMPIVKSIFSGLKPKTPPQPSPIGREFKNPVDIGDSVHCLCALTYGSNTANGKKSILFSYSPICFNASRLLKGFKGVFSTNCFTVFASVRAYCRNAQPMAF